MDESDVRSYAQDEIQSYHSDIDACIQRLEDRVTLAEQQLNFVEVIFLILLALHWIVIYNAGNSIVLYLSKHD